MKKITYVLFLAVIFFSVGQIDAQSKKAVSIGGNIALPMGDFGDAAGTGFGATVTGEMELADKIVGTATIGYLMWAEESLGGYDYSYSAIPILAGAKYYFQNNFYAYGQLGFHLFSVDVEPESIYFDGDSDTEFTLGLGAGYEFNQFDITAMFYIISDANYLGIRAAYKIPLQ